MLPTIKNLSATLASCKRSMKESGIESAAIIVGYDERGYDFQIGNNYQSPSVYCLDFILQREISLGTNCNKVAQGMVGEISRMLERFPA